jgi:hypothetical protein
MLTLFDSPLLLVVGKICRYGPVNEQQPLGFYATLASVPT